MSASVLWTGGKDCCLAMMLAKERGYEISELVLFAPEGEVRFESHPLPLIERQAESLSLPLRLIRIAEPYREGYVKAFAAMCHVDTVVTGDIDLVDGLPNWVAECVRDSGAGIEVLMPLWGRDRLGLLRETVKRGIEARISRLVHEALPPEWLGRLIDEGLIELLAHLRQEHGVDPCGENGEYHTMVEWCPGFRFRVAATVA